MKIGGIEIQPVIDGVGREVASEVLTRPGLADPWACHAEHLDGDGVLHMDLGGFLVRHRRRSGDRGHRADHIGRSGTRPGPRGGRRR